MAVTSGLSLSPNFQVKPARSLWTPSWPHLMGMVAFVWLVLIKGLPLLRDPDTHWHITVGNWILQHAAVPRVDTYSYTFTGHPWIAKEWLSQVFLATAYDLGGWGGVVVLAAAAVGVTFALLLRLLLRDLTPFPAVLFTVAAFAMTSIHLLARPHVLAFPFMLWWVAGLVRAVEERRAPKPVLLIAMLLWANLHGGFTLGLLLTGAMALDALVGARDGAERRTLFIAWTKFGVAAFLVACVTPYGPESMLVTFRIFGLGDALSLISEWKSPNFQELPTQELVLLIALYVAFSRGLKLPLVRLLIVIGLTHLFLRYVRNVELLAMLVPLVIAPVLARQWPSLRPNAEASGRLAALARPAGHGLVALCVALSALLVGGMVHSGVITAFEATTPAAALKFAREAGLTKERVFNHYGYGGYLIESGIPTFIDGRGELFGGKFIKRYVDVAYLNGKPHLEDVLNEYHVKWTLLSKDLPANKLLAHLPGWHLAYSDDLAMIFVRDR
ncbi:MAG: hypothetical protein JSR91_20855 [Proteobacteria bacterium]|nr:hypothetical protein [Pseudomonadota bacterium]